MIHSKIVEKSQFIGIDKLFWYHIPKHFQFLIAFNIRYVILLRELFQKKIKIGFGKQIIIQISVGFAIIKRALGSMANVYNLFKRGQSLEKYAD